MYFKENTAQFFLVICTGSLNVEKVMCPSNKLVDVFVGLLVDAVVAHFFKF